MTISSIIIFLLMLFVLVVIHELGHFLLAKFFKMRVDEFAFGFPPSLLQKKIGETIYSFNLVPLGGFVKIFGENGLTEEEIKSLTDSDKKRLFGSFAPWKRIAVLCGGVLFNILGAFIIFVVVFMIGSNVYLEKEEISSVPSSERNLVLVDINEKSPMVGSGIKAGDKVLKMEANGEVLAEGTLDSYSASSFVQKHNNAEIFITYKTGVNETNTISVVPKAGIVEGKKILGAKFADTTFKKATFIEAIPQAAKMTFYQLQFIFTSLYQLISDLIFKDAKVEDNLSGPIGLAIMTTKVSEKGIDQILIFAAMLSLSLAAFNILPIPALDGGRIVFVLAEIIKGRKINANTEQLFHGLGFLALLCLMIFVSYFDIVKAFV